MLCSCSSVDYKRDTSAGEYIAISYQELQNKIDNEEDFIVIFTQEGCNHCLEYKETVVNEYLKKHNVKLFEFILSNEPDYSQDFFTGVQNFTVSLTDEMEKQFLGTPYTMIVQDGILQEGISGTIKEKDFDDLVIQYQLDEEGKYARNANAGVYEPITFAQAKAKIENKETFIALFSQTKCDHCNEYKKTVLAPYLNTHGIHLYDINLTNEENPKETFLEIQEYFKTFTKEEEKQFLGTPFTMVVENGELKEGMHASVSFENIENWVVKYRLDAYK